MEVHVQLRARTKLFSGAPSPSPSSAPNASVAYFDAAHPGSLPRLGVGAVSAALRAALALRASVPRLSAFERKHYAYADLPHGFQVTQLRAPFAVGGILAFGGGGVARVERLQLEMDSGRLLVGDGAVTATRIDLNRAGAALLEVVFAPDVRSPADAAAVVRALQNKLRDVGASEAAMEAGGLRADVNVSVRRVGGGRERVATHDDGVAALDGEYAYGDLKELAGRGGAHAAVNSEISGRGWSWVFKDAHLAAHAIALGKGGGDEGGGGSGSGSGGSDAVPLRDLAMTLTPTALGFGQRVEYKNLNSFRSIAGAVAAESARQVALLEAAEGGSGGSVIDCETRAFDAVTGETRRLRDKESAPDYRFIDEPDVLPLLIPTRVMLAALAAQPASPAARAGSLAAATGISGNAAAALVAAGDYDYFLDALDAALSGGANEGGSGAVSGGAGGGGGSMPRAVPPTLDDEASRNTARTLAAWITNEVAGALREDALREHHHAVLSADADERAFRTHVLSPLALGELVALISRGGVSAGMGKGLLRSMIRHGCTAPQAAALAGVQIDAPPPSDDDMEAFARAAVAAPALSGAVTKYKSGRGEHALGPLIAHVVSAVGGAHADAARARKALTAVLGPPPVDAAPHEGRKARAKRLAEEARLAQATVGGDE